MGRRPAVPAGFVCESVGLPGIKWTSSTDETRLFPVPIKCVPLAKPLDSGDRQFATWYKILRLIEAGF